MTRPSLLTLPAADFQDLDRTTVEMLRGRSILMTGGTGFVGSWTLECLYRTCRDGQLKLEIQVLSRDPRAFLEANPHYASWPALRMITGDVRSLDPLSISADWIFHGATPASQHLNDSDPLEMIDIIVQGTRRVLDLAARCRAKRVLFLSSGLAYGSQPPDCEAISENEMGRLDAMDPRAAYGNAKHFAEHLCVQHARAAGFEACIARLFAFVGPLLPLDAHYAAGNFMRDGLAHRTVHVHGDGTPLRTYLHAGELARWLWTLMARGRAGEVYNVGSDEVVSIRELAEHVGRICGVGVEIAGVPKPGQLPARYVPDIRKAGGLGLHPHWGIESSLRRTLAWHRGREHQ